MNRRWVLLLGCLLVVLGCQKEAARQSATLPMPSVAAHLQIKPLQAAGLHNVFQVTGKLYSGSSPEGPQGFRSLQKLGIRTIISVDGAMPDVEGARQFGLCYVHLPFGYDGIPKDRGMELALAVKELPGPIYLHCHHGKHRGPAAVAAIIRCLDEQCTVNDALAWLKQAGTDPHYRGLYDVPLSFTPARFQTFQPKANAFPERNNVSNLSRLMVEMEHRIDHLKRIQKADWQTPPEHPDLDPPHEALLLWEGYQETGRLELADYPQGMQQQLKDAQTAVKELENYLRLPRDERTAKKMSIEQAFFKVAADCTRCHARYRDQPRDR